ncbi:MFS transporter [Shimazuella sp. AN120528]|uniref:MFS transporter n=1 Tax=Shimazuella soli TaxID=1892854 RepID=UPI001F0EB6CE|nr:MFS transporter [Shimazuella soli]MCH5584734.1 MFS transporter [Shimazuella soli]
MKKVTCLFFFIMFFIGADLFIVSPLLPTLRTAFHISVEHSGWIVSAFALGYALFALLAGPLSDGWDRKKVMMIGLLSFGLFTLLCGFATTFWGMLLFRFLAGISGAFVTPQVWASIPQLIPSEKILKAMGIVTAGLAVSQMIGVPIGSYLAAFNWRTPFFAVGACSFFMVILIVFFLPSIPPILSEKKSPSILKRYRVLLQESRSKITFFAYFVFQLGNFATFTFMGTWFADRFNLDVASIGSVILFLGLGNTLSSFFSSNWVQKIGLKNSFIWGVIVLILLFIVLPFLPNIIVVTIFYSFIYVVIGMVFPIIMRLLQTLSTSSRGTISSLANATMYLGSTIGSTVAGILYANASGFLSVSLFTVLCLLSSLLLFQKSGVLPSSQQCDTKVSSA